MLREKITCAVKVLNLYLANSEVKPNITWISINIDYVLQCMGMETAQLIQLHQRRHVFFFFFFFWGGGGGGEESLPIQ